MGYAHLDHGEPAEGASAEVVVHPDARRRGVGRALVTALRSATDSGPLRLWSHGHLAAARDFAAADGFTNVRELWQMRRPLGAGAPPLAAVRLPAGFAARTVLTPAGTSRPGSRSTPEPSPTTPSRAA